MILKFLILALIALAALICYAALVAGTDAEEMEQAYWQDKARKEGRKESANDTGV